jgi:hypothetical protein
VGSDSHPIPPFAILGTAKQPGANVMIQRQWLSAEPPFRYGLTAEGDLWIEFDVLFGHSDLSVKNQMGLRIPREELQALRVGLGMTQGLIEETLSAKPPTQGAH